MEDKYPKRKNMRNPRFNYSYPGAFFITICTKDKKSILSSVIKNDDELYPKVVLTNIGAIADKYINQLKDFYDNIFIKQYVIMPNHIHLIIQINRTVEMNDIVEPQQTPAKLSKLSLLISTFKRFCNKEYGENIWQSRSFDHVIRNEFDYAECVKYIKNNPRKWYYTYNPDKMIRK